MAGDDFAGVNQRCEGDSAAVALAGDVHGSFLQFWKLNHSLTLSLPQRRERYPKECVQMQEATAAWYADKQR
jgi:hypothetical protein